MAKHALEILRCSTTLSMKGLMQIFAVDMSFVCICIPLLYLLFQDCKFEMAVVIAVIMRYLQKVMFRKIRKIFRKIAPLGPNFSKNAYWTNEHSSL